jgi:hypothetical protein
MAVAQPYVDAAFGFWLPIRPPTQHQTGVLAVVIVAAALASLLPTLRAHRQSLAGGMIVRTFSEPTVRHTAISRSPLAGQPCCPARPGAGRAGRLGCPVRPRWRDGLFEAVTVTGMFGTSDLRNIDATGRSLLRPIGGSDRTLPPVTISHRKRCRQAAPAISNPQLLGGTCTRPNCRSSTVTGIPRARASAVSALSGLAMRGPSLW